MVLKQKVALQSVFFPFTSLMLSILEAYIACSLGYLTGFDPWPNRKAIKRCVSMCFMLLIMSGLLAAQVLLL